VIRAAIDPGRMVFSVEGHAGYAEPGADIVCAAASMLAMTLIFRLRTLALPGEIVEEVAEKGRARVSVRPKGRRSSLFRPVFETVLQGFALLAQQYPGYVALHRPKGEKI